MLCAGRLAVFAAFTKQALPMLLIGVEILVPALVERQSTLELVLLLWNIYASIYFPWYWSPGLLAESILSPTLSLGPVHLRSSKSTSRMTSCSSRGSTMISASGTEFFSLYRPRNYRQLIEWGSSQHFVSLAMPKDYGNTRSSAVGVPFGLFQTLQMRLCGLRCFSLAFLLCRISALFAHPTNSVFIDNPPAIRPYVWLFLLHSFSCLLGKSVSSSATLAATYILWLSSLLSRLKISCRPHRYTSILVTHITCLLAVWLALLFPWWLIAWVMLSAISRVSFFQPQASAPTVSRGPRQHWAEAPV